MIRVLRVDSRQISCLSALICENLRLTVIYETAEKSKRPVVLTLNGKAAAVVQDAEAYQHLLDFAAHADDMLQV